MYSHNQLLTIQERINSDEKELQKQSVSITNALNAFTAQSEIRSIWKGNLLVMLPPYNDLSGEKDFEIDLDILPVVLLTRFCDWLIDVSNHCAESVGGDQPKLFDHE